MIFSDAQITSEPEKAAGHYGGCIKNSSGFPLEQVFTTPLLLKTATGFLFV
ncbi:MAG: hypothetical protein IKD85_01935 [Firmicutes bacterium]|nr:hypothetical protein [Bacillota bacterium]